MSFPKQRGVAQILLPKLLRELETLCSYNKGTILLRARPLQVREICGKLHYIQCANLNVNSFKTCAGCQSLVRVGFAVAVGKTYVLNVTPISQYVPNIVILWRLSYISLQGQSHSLRLCTNQP